MSNHQATKKSSIIGAFIFIVLILALLGIYFLNTQETSSAQKSYTLTVVDDLGIETQYTAMTNAEYVGEALRELSKTEEFTFDGAESEFGFFLTNVNGLMAAYDINGAYWAFYLNDTYANLGIDQQPLNDGDNVQLCYERGVQ